MTKEELNDVLRAVEMIASEDLVHCYDVLERVGVSIYDFEKFYGFYKSRSQSRSSWWPFPVNGEQFIQYKNERIMALLLFWAAKGEV